MNMRCDPNSGTPPSHPLTSTPTQTHHRSPPHPTLLTPKPRRCDVDIRKDLYGGIVLTGGTAGFVALRDRLEKEVTDLAPQMAKVKVR